MVASRLPATRVIRSEATTPETIWSMPASWAGAVASAIGGAGTFFAFTIEPTTSSPSRVTRMALRTRGSSRS